jgi:hypothetical protein
MSMSILGVYKRDAFNKTLRVGTPDPTKYHDSRSVRLEGAQGAPVAAKMPANEKFTLPGVIIPRATRHGASTGNNHETPGKAFIDPELTNGQVVVDLNKIRNNPDRMIDAIREANAQGFEDDADAVIEAFAKFAEPVKGGKHIREIMKEVPKETRDPPIQMPGTYVVPKASPGGGQLKAASFKQQAASLEAVTTPRKQRSEICTPVMQTVQDKASEVEQEVVVPASIPQQAAMKARSLHDELAWPSNTVFVPSSHSKGMRRVTFELPNPAQPGASLGQFAVLYHDIIREDMNLVLIYDHSQPAQMVWFPPMMEDPKSHEPIGIAALVHGLGSEPDILYKAYPTGVKFRYRNEEFCILTVEREKQMDSKS